MAEVSATGYSPIKQPLWWNLEESSKVAMKRWQVNWGYSIITALTLNLRHVWRRFLVILLRCLRRNGSRSKLKSAVTQGLRLFRL